jgi:GNAT superfamily N-acetyltransferase
LFSIPKEDDTLMTLPLSNVEDLRAIELASQHEELLQQFFVDNPEYFIKVSGEKASPNEAHETIHDGPPAGWTYSRKIAIGYLNKANRIAATVDVIQDLLAPNVWHIGLFMIDANRYGTGEAQAIFRGIETWAVNHGAQWLRLGVVLGNSRAESFWQSMGFNETRTREGVEMGQRVNTIRVMFKPLCGGTLAQYLTWVERDRPEKTNI